MTKKTDKKVGKNESIEKMLKNKDNKQKIIALCKSIHDKMNGNWFTIEKLAKRMNFEVDIARDTLVTINMFGFLAEKPKDTNKSVFEYKIVHNKAAELSVARLDKQMLQERLKDVDKEIERLEGEVLREKDV